MSIVTNMQRAAEQIGAQYFSSADMPLVREITMIMAEMYSLPPEVTARIGGEPLPVSVVREIYSMLTHEHIAWVIDFLKKTEYEIKRKKTYIRTVLYNSAFEMEFSMMNALAVEFGAQHGK